MSNLLFQSVLVLSFVCCLLVQGQRVAEKKCSKFRELTIVRPSFSGNPIPIQRFNCPRTVDLILTGEVVKPGEFPHQALLGYANPDAPEGYNFNCGGSLISERFVLTAAHCFSHGYPEIVRLGEHSLKDENDNQIDLEIEKIFKHPQHSFRTAYNDIALIKLNQNVRFSSSIRPACLWTGDNFNVSSLIATGFGLYDLARPDSADVLQKVMLHFLDREQCDKAFRGRKFPQGVLDSQLCIGSEHGGKDTFAVDSGAPIQVITEPKGCTYHVLGVTSMVTANINTQPTAITKVSSYLDWIEQTVWPNEE